MEAAAQPSSLAGFIPIIAIFAIFYFLVIRPQQKQTAEHKKMLGSLKKGDRVLTTGGLYGTVVNLKAAVRCRYRVPLAVLAVADEVIR